MPAWGLRLRRATMHSRYRTSRDGVPVDTTHVRSLIWRFRSSMSRPHIPLSNASRATSRLPSHSLGPGWVAIPYLYDFFHHCSTPVYPDAIRVLPQA